MDVTAATRRRFIDGSRGPRLGRFADRDPDMRVEVLGYEANPI